MLAGVRPGTNESLQKQFIAEAERLYGCAVRTPPFATEEAIVYRCMRSETPFILKALPSRQRSPARQLSILDFVTHLRQHGVPAPAPVPSLADRLIETAVVGEEPYTLWAVEEVRGARVSWRAWTPSLFHQWGALLGRMHALAKTYVPAAGTQQRTWEDEWVFDYRHIPASFATIRREADVLYEWMLSLPQTEEAYGFSHADFHQENFFLDGTVLRPFDFDNCLCDWFIADFTPIFHNALLAQAFHYGRGEYDRWTAGQAMPPPEFASYFLRHFWDGYWSEHSLDPSWLATLPSFFYRRHLSVWTGRVKSQSAARSEFPWRSFEQHTAELEDPAWIDALFTPALRGLEPR